MITLPLKLRKNGFEYTQVLRGKRCCIYEHQVSDSVTNYEVFLIKIRPERKIGKSIIPEHEAFPHDEAFGYWAWTIRPYEAAKWRFDELEARKTRREFTKPGTNILKY